MFESQEIHAEHKDIIHDVSYDYYGQRMATCSSDQYVKVWDRTEEEDKWTLSSSWKAHSASIWKVTWAHPEFGQVLATCSYDRTAAVWEEVVEDTSGSNKCSKKWVRRANLVDSRTSVTDVKFGPKMLGLLLATCSGEGIIRIYEAPDVMNLSQWTLQHEVQCKITLSCLDWNPSLSRMHPPMIAVGSDDTGPGGKVFIYEYNENSRKWIELNVIDSITDPVHDIKFSPNLGRLIHILGVATKDVRIIYLTPVKTDEPTPNGITKLDVETVAQFDDHGSTVWRVTWNVFGNELTSTGDDGYVRQFKMSDVKTWRPTTTLKADGTQVPTGTEAARSSSQNIPQGTPVSTIASQTARYIKLGSIAQPSRESWH